MLRALALALAVLAAVAAPASGAVPRGWLGMTVDGPLQAQGYDGEWDLMTASGVESVRAAFYWRDAQPYPSPAAVPAAEAGRFRAIDGVPTDFAATDRIVLAAAQRRLPVLPVVLGTPGWAAEDPNDLASPPRDPTAFARFMAALVGRYGPRGTFWGEHPQVRRQPIRSWQVWNEPNLQLFWSRQPFADGYVALLRAAHGALRRADPGSRTILAGLANRSWQALRAIYDAGGRGWFDAVAVHPYTAKPRNVVLIVRFARREMARYHDLDKPVWVTELSWPASLGKVGGGLGFETDDRGQARRLATALIRLAAARRALRIERVYWYTWLSAETGSANSFDYAGLRRLRDGRVVNAPALRAFRRVARLLRR